MKLLQNLNTRLDQKITRLYGSYKKQRIKALEKELATLIAQEKALLRKLLPLQAQIEAKKQEKTKLQRTLSSF